MIKRLSGRKDTKNDDLKNALRNLVNTKVEYNILGKDRERRGIFTVLSNAEIEVQGRGKRTLVTFEFPDKLLQAIKHPSIYVRLNLLVLRGDIRDIKNELRNRINSIQIISERKMA